MSVPADTMVKRFLDSGKHHLYMPTYHTTVFLKDKEMLEGPSGATLIKYEWRWKWGMKFVPGEGGVEARVSDWDRFERCAQCNSKIVHIYWVRSPDDREDPYGADDAHIALGFRTPKPPPHIRKKLKQMRKQMDELFEVTDEVLLSHFNDATATTSYAAYAEAYARPRKLRVSKTMEYDDGVWFTHYLTDRILVVGPKFSDRYREVSQGTGWQNIGSDNIKNWVDSQPYREKMRTTAARSIDAAVLEMNRREEGNWAEKVVTEGKERPLFLYHPTTGRVFSSRNWNLYLNESVRGTEWIEMDPKAIREHLRKYPSNKNSAQ